MSTQIPKKIRPEMIGYYLGGDEPAKGVWRDFSGASGLNNKPVRASELKQRAETNDPTAVIGYDIVISAPQQLSIQWAAANDEQKAQIETAQHAAVEQVTRYINSLAKPATPLFALFPHQKARDGKPCLHTHVCIFNADSETYRSMLFSRFAIDEKYHAEIAKRLAVTD